MLYAALFLRADACRSGFWERAPLADWPVASLACRDAIAWRLSGAQERTHALFLKKETLRKNQKLSKNQWVDSNLCVCKVSINLLEIGKTGAISSLRDGSITPIRRESREI